MRYYADMMNVSLFAGLAGFALVSSITPGPNNLMLMASGTNFGFRRTLPHMLGVSLGFTLMVFLVGLGLATALQRYPASFRVLQAVSVVYLVYLAWRIATAPPPTGNGNEAGGRPLTLVQAALFQWVNPKAWTMALTAIAVYCGDDRHIGALALVALVFGLINLPAVGLWAFVGSKLVAWLRDPVRLRWFNMGAASLIVATIYPVVAQAI